MIRVSEPFPFLETPKVAIVFPGTPPVNSSTLDLGRSRQALFRSRLRVRLKVCQAALGHSAEWLQAGFLRSPWERRHDSGMD